MPTELKLCIDDDLNSKIQQFRELSQAVSDIEDEAEVEGREIDYANFYQYTELHNLNHSIRLDLANAACLALDVIIWNKI